MYRRFYQGYRRNKTATFILFMLPLLFSCSNDLEELEKLLAAKKYGIYVNLSLELQQIIALPNSKTTVELRILDVLNGTERSLSLDIVDDIDIASNEEIPPFGEFRYLLQVLHTSKNTGDEPMLVAAASKTSNIIPGSYELRVEFSADELQTTGAFDLNDDATINAGEDFALDFDEDTRSNLAEIIEGANPKNSAPTFTSSTAVSVAEYNRNRSSAYVFYTALAITPRRDSNGAAESMVYSMPVSDPRLAGLINTDAGSGEISIAPGQRLPRYNTAGDDNTYSITLTAADESAPNDLATLTLTLTITDEFNLIVQPAANKTKALHFKWDAYSDSEGNAADYYKLLRDIDDGNGFTYLVKNGPEGTPLPLNIETIEYFHEVALHLSDAFQGSTKFKLEAYRKNSDPGFSDALLETSSELMLGDYLAFPQDLTEMIGNLSSSNSVGKEWFGFAIALSADGSILAVGSPHEDRGVDGGSLNDCNNRLTPRTNCRDRAGTVRVYEKFNNSWNLLPIIMSPNFGVSYRFGWSVALSADGKTLVVGAPSIAYIFNRELSGKWISITSVVAPNPEPGDFFAWSVALSADGNTLAVAAILEDGGATGITLLSDVSVGNSLGDSLGDGSPDNSIKDSGVVYIYRRESNAVWNPEAQAYVKGTRNQVAWYFGKSIALSGNGNTLVVMTDYFDTEGELPGELARVGIAYVYERKLDGEWNRQAQAEIVGSGPGRGISSVSLSSDGNTLAVGWTGLYRRTANGQWDLMVPANFNGQKGAPSGQIALNADGSIIASGYPYIYQLDGSGAWNYNRQAYVKAADTQAGDSFGASLALSADGKTLAVGAPYKESGLNGSPVNDCKASHPAYPTNCLTGAVYLY